MVPTAEAEVGDGKSKRNALGARSKTSKPLNGLYFLATTEWEI